MVALKCYLRSQLDIGDDRSFYPDDPLREEGAVGWRAQVARKRGVGTEVQVRVFGSWIRLHDTVRISPVVQEEQGGGVQLDSSDDEVPQKRGRVR